MNSKRLALILIVGGTSVIALAVIWFAVAYGDTLEMASSFWGRDHMSNLVSCLYATSAICDGVAMMSDGPSYSPMLFWIGVLALLGGIVVQFASGSRGAAGTVTQAAATDAARSAPGGEILSFIPPDQYPRYSYILALSGAVAGLLIAPLAIVALAGFVLALLGLTAFRPRMSAVDRHHLALVGVVFAAAAVLLISTRGTFPFLLVALAQIAALYLGFQAYRAGRLVDLRDLPGEVRRALPSGVRSGAGSDQP